MQLHGDEPPAYADALDWPVFRAVSVSGLGAAADAWSADTTLLVDNIDLAPAARFAEGAARERAVAAVRDGHLDGVLVHADFVRELQLEQAVTTLVQEFVPPREIGTR